MDRSQSKNTPARLERQLAHLKIISRLLGHELHVQTSPRITLSRDEVIEIQTSIDLFIEEIAVLRGSAGAAPSGLDVSGELAVQAVPNRH